MQGKMTVIEVDGTEVVTDWDHTPSGDELRAVLGGWIEFAPYFTQFRGEQAVAVIDEEGKLKGLPVNRKATTHWLECVRTNDVLQGRVIVLTGDDEFFADL